MLIRSKAFQNYICTFSLVTQNATHIKIKNKSQMFINIDKLLYKYTLDQANKNSNITLLKHFNFVSMRQLESANDKQSLYQ